MAKPAIKHHPHDFKWICEQIARLPVHLQPRAEAGYSLVYQEAHDAEPVEHKKENAARFAANTRLRKFVEKVLAQVN